MDTWCSLKIEKWKRSGRCRATGCCLLGELECERGHMFLLCVCKWVSLVYVLLYLGIVGLINPCSALLPSAPATYSSYYFMRCQSFVLQTIFNYSLSKMNYCECAYLLKRFQLQHHSEVSLTKWKIWYATQSHPQKFLVLWISTNWLNFLETRKLIVEKVEFAVIVRSRKCWTALQQIFPEKWSNQDFNVLCEPSFTLFKIILWWFFGKYTLKTGNPSIQVGHVIDTASHFRTPLRASYSVIES